MAEKFDTMPPYRRLSTGVQLEWFETDPGSRPCDHCGQPIDAEPRYTQGGEKERWCRGNWHASDTFCIMALGDAIAAMTSNGLHINSHSRDDHA